MFFSCKITSSAIQALAQAGVDLELLYQDVDTPEEFLRDPSCWLEADKMERFLERAEALSRSLEFPEYIAEHSFVTYLGHRSYHLRAWGVLDSVLRMMQRPQDVFLQPDRFISYFIRPAPALLEWEREGQRIGFDLPIRAEDYPLTSSYLRAAVEAIPSFVGHRLAGVEWRAYRMQICWEEEDQQQIFGVENDPGRVLKPELAQHIVESLESSQKELEQKNHELSEKNRQLEEAKQYLETQIVAQQLPVQEGMSGPQSLSNLAKMAEALAKEIQEPMQYIHQQVLRLSDYMARAQQLITLLGGRSLGEKQIQEAMRRMDWLQIRETYPHLVQNTSDAIQNLKGMLNDLSLLTQSHNFAEQDLQLVDVNDKIEKLVQDLPLPSLVQLHKQLLLDKKLRVNPLRFEQALSHLLQHSLVSLGVEGELRLRSLRMDTTAILEIYFSNNQRREEDLVRDFNAFRDGVFSAESGLSLPLAKSIIEGHGGQLTALTNAQGTKFVIQLEI